MATCACGVVLPGRQQKCSACKERRDPKKRAPAKARASRTAKAAAKKPTRKRTAKKTTGAARGAVAYPGGLRVAGRRLWKALGHDIETPAGILALEACRAADRLEHLDSILNNGDGWTDLVEQLPGSGRFIIVVDRPLSEARQLQLALKQMLAELGAVRVKGAGTDRDKPTPSPAELSAKNAMDEIAERRRRREQEA